MDQLGRDIAEAGLRLETTEKYFVHPELTDGFLYSGKFDPKRYLDPRFRKGISSFSALNYKEEVEAGLKKLGQDIESGRINEVMRRYENDRGDYLFIVSKRE